MSRKIYILLLLLVSMPGFLYSSTTGKIAGYVLDKETGEPMIGANVIVVGTTLGSSTDLDGHFVILKVPVGYHSIRVTYIGYSIQVLEKVRVNVDLTTELKFKIKE